MLLGTDGSFLVHPDSAKRLKEKVYTQLERGSDASVKAVVDAMMSGQEGYQQMKMKGKDCYIFFKPFKRNEVQGRYIDDLGWRALSILKMISLAIITGCCPTSWR